MLDREWLVGFEAWALIRLPPSTYGPDPFSGLISLILFHPLALVYHVRDPYLSCFCPPRGEPSRLVDLHGTTEKFRFILKIGPKRLDWLLGSISEAGFRQK